MATPTQNQARMGPAPNVLSNENHPNTLGGIGPPALAPIRLPVGLLAAAVISILAAVALLMVTLR
jgi:hypothetical protein